MKENEENRGIGISREHQFSRYPRSKTYRVANTGVRFVARSVEFFDFSAMASKIIATCSGVFPCAKTTSGKLVRSWRRWSILAKEDNTVSMAPRWSVFWIKDNSAKVDSKVTLPSLNFCNRHRMRSASSETDEKEDFATCRSFQCKDAALFRETKGLSEHPPRITDV